MGKFKEIIIERENTLRNLIREVDCLTEHMTDDETTEVWKAWVGSGLPLDEGSAEIHDIALDSEIYDYTEAIAREFINRLQNISD